MSLSDPIADFLTRVRNGSQAKQRYVDVRWSKIVQHMCDVLKESHFIDQYLVREQEGKMEMRVFLRYDQRGRPLIRGLKRVSTPGNRVYVSRDRIPGVFNGLGISIVSTSHGVMSSHEAHKSGVGGEVLCKAW